MLNWELLTAALDPRRGTPVFVQLSEALANDIRTGRLKPGDPLPGTRALATLLLLAATGELVTAFDYAHDPPRVVIDLSDADVLDSAAAAAIDDILHRYAARGQTAEITGVSHTSAVLLRGLKNEKAANS